MFNCQNCGTEFKAITTPNKDKSCPKCGTICTPALPKNGIVEVMETLDQFRGTKAAKNLDKMLKQRKHEHHEKYEISEKVDKWGMDEAVQNGWLKAQKKPK